MKRSLGGYFLLAVIQAMTLFVMAFAIHYVTAMDSNRGIIVSGAEIYSQEYFAPYDAQALQEMDAQFRNTYPFYRGFSYYDVTTDCTDEWGRTHKIYMASDGLDIRHFAPLKEGVYYDEVPVSEGSYPVVVGGKYFDRYALGEYFVIQIPNVKDAQQSIRISAFICGKVEESSYRFPEPMSYLQSEERGKDGFILCGDEYLSQAVDLSDKQVMLNYDRLHSACTQEQIDLLHEQAKQYGSFIPVQNAIRSDILSLYTEKQSVYYCIALAVLLLVISVASVCLQAKDRYGFLLATCTSLFAIGGALLSIGAFDLSYAESILAIGNAEILLSIGIAIVGWIPSLIHYLIASRKSRMIEKGKKYEKI